MILSPAGHVAGFFSRWNEWKIASTTPPPMALASSEIVSQYSLSQRGSTSPTLSRRRLECRHGASRAPPRRSRKAPLRRRLRQLFPRLEPGRRWRAEHENGRCVASATLPPKCAPPRINPRISSRLNITDRLAEVHHNKASQFRKWQGLGGEFFPSFPRKRESRPYRHPGENGGPSPLNLIPFPDRVRGKLPTV